MGRKAKLAVCSLNQWAIDFEGNYERIVKSIKLAHANGAAYRLGSELEITGYGSEDHYYESDTLLHSWQVLAKLLQMKESKTMICDVGMPVMHRSIRFNCRIIYLHKKIILVRPKLTCCNDGNFRELRWFAPWFKQKQTEDFVLPHFIQEITGQSTVPIGDAIISTKDTCIGSEICEELWTARSTHVAQSLAGVEIFTNSSGSHFNLRKAHERVDMVLSATSRVGGVYMWANQLGCDGNRVYYDGCSMIAINGDIVVQGPQFSIKDVEVEIATVELDDVLMRRGNRSSQAIVSAQENDYPRILLHDFTLCSTNSPINYELPLTPVVNWHFYSPEEEIGMGPACWLWDYLKRSGQSGFFLPLSGGVDSSSVACIVYIMCNMIHKEVADGNTQLMADVRRVMGSNSYSPSSAEDLCSHILTTCYMASENSSTKTRKRSNDLAHRIGSNHIELNIESVVNAVIKVFTTVTGLIPKFKARGGTQTENLALQNIQARIRMVLAYVFAQLMQWVKGKPGSLLVLGTSNVDEALRGYYTKYDCSSADINPIGGISKTDLRSFIYYVRNTYKIEALKEIVEAPPTAELEPLTEGEVTQTDEHDMGMTYQELSTFGKLRKISMCGPYSMFIKLVTLWRETCSPSMVAQKVKHFFVSHGINRHKMTTLTPAMHAENYSPDDNRFDLRPFLYNKNWTWQFREIDAKVTKMEAGSKTDVTATKVHQE
ncbi:unnamed protein product [Clavelina lepadiformis]|uniref:Glutamine-dependent NAD(+) synthetase n=1 Tax=Clavelina lepadiformis TaxID=159417 RepID=A0ABP0GK50_CLALP